MTKKILGNIAHIVLGTFILSLSVELFIIPFNILSGGVAGIAVAMEPLFHINKTLLANCLTVSLFFVGWMFLGKEFALNTVLSSALYPVFTSWMSTWQAQLSIDPVLASFYSGLLGGIGIGLVMRTGASTGGMDIPPLVLSRLTGVKVATLVMITDALTVSLGVIAYDISSALVGLVSVFACGYAIDKVLSAGVGMNAKSVTIISDHWMEIRNEIDKQLRRGCTILQGKGGYHGDEKNVILCVVSGHQYTRLLEIIRKVDAGSFVITTDATDMHGEGFTYASPNL
ncbi:MAG: YitT family protein [Solobacterium sp.]|nr:YitT family protein [Solobacterium sp.]